VLASSLQNLKKTKDLYTETMMEGLTEEEVKLLNYELVKLTDMATEHIYANAEEDFRYGIHITDGRFRFDLEENSEKADIIERYTEELKKVM